MKHIGTTTENEVILTLKVSEIRDILLYLNSAQLRYIDRDLNKALKECLEKYKELYDIWQSTK